ncbi:MAG: hypothetical protein F2653_01235 [Actinobacteria bacterium]|uniref:Unannotated protein n=1 Tax=freshwater metagenome TaxID=449393 RepID=A0A6J6PXG7_9ZZZZ|nr:hypothetical protein [Actinomycetota bacterium]MSW21818.1 hypothetical protein [Actinomycetota bacterium]MSX03628.1 hypothetical protein [Actinomycetota bacterium]MSX83968.1 hypothetical protein [Actinomycetota bacterium]MSY96046.1 hypothetical protein [Actinomycetota bacterium]
MTSLKFDIAFSAASFPRLRSGVNYFAVGNEFNPCMYAGFSHRGVELESQIAKYLLQLLDGSHTLESIYQLLAGNLKEVAEILKVLDREQLIEFRTSKLVTFVEGEFAPVNLISFTNKMRAEENLYCWHPAISIDRSSESLINSRRNFAIIIFGRNRLALSLFSILQASGFSQVKIIDRSISSSSAESVQIAPEEVCGLAIRGSDVGMRKASVIADLARNSQLFPAQDLAFPTVPDFIISTETIPQETLQRWMSEATPHLAISNLIENRVEIGPIVLPGKSPCLNCLSLWRSEQYPHHKEFELIAALDGTQVKSLELPSAQVALLSGIIAIHVIEYCANQFQPNQNVSQLVGATQSTNLFEPQGAEVRYWQPHIACGCQRLI